MGVFCRDPPDQSTDGLGGLGRVFRQVGGDGNVGDLAVAGELDGARINLGATSDVPAFRPSWVADGGEPGHARDPSDDVGQRVGAEGRVGRKDPLRVKGVVAVEAEDGVEVDQAAPLELGDLGVGQFDPCRVLASLSSCGGGR